MEWMANLWNGMVCWYIWYLSQDILHVPNSENSMVFDKLDSITCYQTEPVHLAQPDNDEV